MSDGPLEKYSISKSLGWIHNGDLLLFRASKWFTSRAIAIAGRGHWSHVGMAAWWGSRLICLEVREWKGGRAVTLASQVARYPGKIEVFHVKPEFCGAYVNTTKRMKQYDRLKVIGAMIDMTGCDYGWWHLLGAAVRHLPVLRLFTKPVTNGDVGKHPPFCSEACSIAARLHGPDPVPQLANRMTCPSDLARSMLWYSSGRVLVP